ncbi:hypothetical protein QR97_39155 [Streptomyces sp. PBH53]|nr:hypothetical protein QR97_39155 [Streptomyces sp. PBH53]
MQAITCMSRKPARDAVAPARHGERDPQVRGRLRTARHRPRLTGPGVPGEIRGDPRPEARPSGPVRPTPARGSRPDADTVPPGADAVPPDADADVPGAVATALGTARDWCSSTVRPEPGPATAPPARVVDTAHPAS